MPDWTKRVSEERADDIAPDNLQAACYFQGRGSAIGQITYGAVRGIGGELIGGALANQKAASAREKAMGDAKGGYNTFDGSLAARLPNDKGVIAVTDRRIVVFGYKQGMLKTKIEDVVASIDRDQLTGWSYKSGKLASILNLAFADESSVGIELPRANKPDAFAEALGIPTID